MADELLTMGEQFNTAGISNIAPSYQPVIDTPTPQQSLFPDWVNNIKAPAKSADITPEINSIIQDIRYNSMDLLQGKGKSGVDSVIAEMFPNSNKIDATYDVSIRDTHELLSDGKTWIPKYEVYKPGADNNALNSSMQSGWEKFFNPIQRAGVKVSRGIFADIGSFVYGIGEAALTGRAESVFDNGMSNYIDDLDKRSDFAYKNYYTESQNGLGANLYTWDKLLGGAEFTARMLGAEAIIALATGGTSLPASFARQGARLGLMASRGARAIRAAETLEDVVQIGRNASKISNIIKQPVINAARTGGGVFSGEALAINGVDSAIRAGKTADYLKQARFAITGSMYESGFETRHYQQEAENAFWDYYRQKGVEPEKEEIDNFYNKLDDTSWNVFTANMGLLSVSNMALFGNMMNIKNPFVKLADGSFINKNIFKIGTQKTAEGLYAPIKAGFFNKALAYTAPIAKGAFVEGVFEEGGQGIASSMMKNYIASTYDPKAMKETADYASSFSKSFKDQFSTKEGIEEIVIGGIIGGLFGGGASVLGMGEQSVGSKYKQQEFVAQVQNTLPQVANNIVSNLYTNESLASILGHNNRLQQITERQEKAIESSDVSANTLHSAESFISALQATSTVGKTDEFLNVLKESLVGMDSNQLAEGQNISLDQVEAFKQDKIAGVTAISENYNKAREAAQYLFGRGDIGGFTELDGKKINRNNLIDSFAYVTTMGKVSEQLASDAYSAFQTKLAEIGTNSTTVEEFGTIAALHTAGQKDLTRYAQASSEQSRLIKQRQGLEQQVITLQQQESTPANITKLQSIAENLLQLNTEINTATNNKELYWTAITDNFYQKLGNTGYLPQADLTNFEDKINTLQERLNSSNISEFDKIELNTLLNEFDKSNTIFKSFNSLANALSSSDFNYKTYSGLFSGVRAKNDISLNDLTKNALIDLYNTDTNISRTLETFKTEPSPITKELINSLNTEEEYVLPPDALAYVTDKVKNKSELTAYEQQVYDIYKDQIDQSVTDIIADPILVNIEETDINNYQGQITSRKKEIADLKKGIANPEIQSEIDRINSEIERIQGEITNIKVNPIVTEELDISEIEAQRQTELDRLNYQGFNSNTKDLSDEERQKLKDDVKAKIEALPDDQVYLVHQTAEDTASDLFKNGFKLQGAIESTFLMMSKNTMIETFSNLIDGNTYHRGATGAFVYALPKSFYGNVKLTAGNTFDSMVENIDGFTGIDMPTQFNLGYFNNGVFSTETEVEINTKYDIMLNQVTKDSVEIQQIQTDVSVLNTEIEALEKEIQFLENSKKVNSDRLKNLKETREYKYKQYEYTKRNGDVVLGWIEVRNGKTFFVNKNESIYLGQENTTVISSFEGLSTVSEEQVILEGNEVFINDKIYKVKDLDSNITKDSDGNYEVTVKSKNGKAVVITGSIADMIVYQHTLNKFLEQATNEQIRELREQAERDRTIEEKYEELISKTENRADAKVSLASRKEAESQKRAEELDRLDKLEEERLENLQNNNNQISQLEEAKKFIVQDRIQDLNTEISELKSKDSAENKLITKRASLNERISILNTEILSDIANDSENIDLEIDLLTANKQLSKKPYYVKIKKLRKLEAQLRDLDKIKKDFNPNDTYVNQLQWVIDNANLLGFESVEGLTSVPVPSQEEVERYTELSKNKKRTSPEQVEMEELKEKLLPAVIVQGSQFEGVSLIDIIENHNQLEVFSDLEEGQIEELPEEEVKKAISKVKDQELTPEYKAPNVGLAYDGTFTQGGNGLQTLHHVKLSTVFNSALSQGLPITIQEFKIDGNNVVYMNEIDVNSQNNMEMADKYDNFNGVKITIGNSIILEKSETSGNFLVSGDINYLLQLFPYDITGQSTSYNLLYEQKSDGTYSPKESEFEVTRDGNVIPFDKTTLNQIKPGENVTLFFDVNDDYNKTLTQEEYVNKGNIYILKNGNLVNILKAKPNFEVKNGGWADLMNVRKQVISASVKNTTVSISVTGTYLGLPIITLDNNGQAEQRVIEEDKVVSYGYLSEKGEYNFFNQGTKVTNSQYTDAYKELGKVIPIVAFNYNSNVYTFPIQLKPQGINVQNELDDILNNPNLTEYKKMFQVNGLLSKYGLDNSNLAWTNQNDTRQLIRNTLENVLENVDIKDQEDFMNSDKYIVINMSDPFMSSKLVLDLQAIEKTKEKTNTTAKTKPITQKGKDEADENKCTP